MEPENNNEVIQAGDDVTLWVEIRLNSDAEAGKTVAQCVKEFCDTLQIAYDGGNLAGSFSVYDAVRMGQGGQNEQG